MGRSSVMDNQVVIMRGSGTNRERIENPKV